MALITCPECGRKKVSDTAEACPSCGFGIKAYFEKKYEESLGLSQEVYAFYILDFIREQYPLVTEK